MRFQGIIEGFYGRAWEWSSRAAVISLLRQYTHLNAYIYAPKQARQLRSDWQSPIDSDHKLKLLALSSLCARENVLFGLGISPLNAFCDYSTQKKQAIRHKISELNDTPHQILCILFDDMRGEITDLAKKQADICADIQAVSEAEHIIMCPTYYSYDMVLENIFGKKPENYWQSLSESIPSDIDFFWTGEKVCTSHYSPKHLLEISKLLGRKVTIWDNYPVNDGKELCNYLRIAGRAEQPFTEAYVQGHFYNPMNQPFLSLIPIITDLTSACTNKTIERFCSKDLATILIENIDAFSRQGLTGLSSREQIAIKSSLRKIKAAPASISSHIIAEVTEWLEGHYAFDPNCLTD